MGRKYSFRSGYVNAINLQSGTVDITTNASGNGTATVTFEDKFPGDRTPVVILTAQEQDTSGVLCAKNITHTSFVAQVTGSSVTSGTLTVGWFATDQK